MQDKGFQEVCIDYYPLRLMEHARSQKVGKGGQDPPPPPPPLKKITKL